MVLVLMVEEEVCWQGVLEGVQLVSEVDLQVLVEV